jgi:UDP-2,3-diacylglucosamine pyrophosphatase LpxH
MLYRPIVGNHDTLFGGFESWKAYFYPPMMETQTTDSRAYFRVDVNNIHFFFLDLEWGNETNSPEQAAWFRKEIATVPKDDWTIVFSHALYYTSGIYSDGANWSDNQAMIKEFVPLFKEYGVDIVFSGHNHHMELLQSEGIYYGVIGTFGGKPDPERQFNGTGSIWYQTGKFGFAEISLQGNLANITYRSPEYAQYFTYSFVK